ncbi:MAG: FesM [Chloroflexi bacterium]|nr:FesM [Chloroflexota bacterium]MCY4247841.1 FesM [Chloroflexota bacterium]
MKAEQRRFVSGRDSLRLPLLGPLLLGRYGRLLLQAPLTVLALLLVIDGFTGPQSAARNLATVAPWVHYRGLVVLALLLAGNLFCMGCPFTLPRSLAKRLSSRGRRFPQRLRNKWLAIGSLFALFFAYESFDLWASPLLTAWLIVAYFIASFVLEALFSESAFCKYICPLGSFNMVYSTLSPTQISVRSHDTCAQCVGKECVNGSYAAQPIIRIDEITADSGAPLRTVPVAHGPSGALGCGTELFAPQVQSNMDCTMCLDCVRACPHDNAGLFLRAPGGELDQPDSLPRRWDMSLLLIALAFMGLSNAFGMVPPYYALQEWLALNLGIASEFVILLLIFGVFNLALPALAAVGAAYAGRQLGGLGRRASLRDTAAAFAPSFVPIGFGIWFAHYSFHFLIGPGLIVPVIQEFLGGFGDWATWSFSLETNIIGLLQAAALVSGFVWSLRLAQKTALRLYRRKATPGLLPWALLHLLLMLAAWQIFTLPMEMRGTLSLFG